jgi:hypothetical protein
MGYIAVMYIKEIFNAVLSIRRLSKVTQVDFKTWGIIGALASAWGAQLFCRITVPAAPLWIVLTAYCLFYVALLYVLSGVSRDDIKWIISLVRNDEGSRTKMPVLYF